MQQAYLDSVKAFLAKHQELLINLKARWDDEKEYEDFADYEKMIRNSITDFKIIKVLKVGVVYEIPGVIITVKCNANHIKYFGQAA